MSVKFVKENRFAFLCVDETPPFGYLFKAIERLLSLLKACFIFPFFLLEAKMCLFFAHLPQLLIRKTIMNPKYVTFFHDIFEFMKRHLLPIFSKQLNVFCLCYRHAIAIANVSHQREKHTY